MSFSEHFFKKAAATTAERRREYGPAADEFRKLAARWSLTLGREVTPQQAVLLLIDLKVLRAARDSDHADSVVDIAGYAACLAEIS